MRTNGSSATVMFANRPEGALDSGGKHSTKRKHSCSKGSLLTRVAAHGIIVPLLYTADDAFKIVQAAKFPPAGARGFGSPFAHERFGIETPAEVSISTKFLTATLSHSLSHKVILRNRNHVMPFQAIKLLKLYLRRKADSEIFIVPAAGK